MTDESTEGIISVSKPRNRPKEYYEKINIPKSGNKKTYLSKVYNQVTNSLRVGPESLKKQDKLQMD